MLLSSESGFLMTMSSLGICRRRVELFPATKVVCDLAKHLWVGYSKRIVSSPKITKWTIFVFTLLPFSHFHVNHQAQLINNRIPLKFLDPPSPIPFLPLLGAKITPLINGKRKKKLMMNGSFQLNNIFMHDNHDSTLYSKLIFHN